jgi:putative sugar O-methyltransferase
MTNEYIGIEDYRSVSDQGPYISAVLESLKNYKNFMKFKKDPRYTAVLEHVTQSQGYEYYHAIKKTNPQFLLEIDKFKENDILGGGQRYVYDEIGLISPSTLRYLKVASDLRFFFGSDLGSRIAEIGVGYGGQLLITDKIFNFDQYDLLDLPPVLSLAEKYIESFLLNGSYDTYTLNKHPGNINYDLVISNYAFSELPSKLQTLYLEKILSQSKRGYLTMNSGRPDCAFIKDKLNIDELKRFLPRFDIFPEEPLTYKGNYILIWGLR